MPACFRAFTSKSWSPRLSSSSCLPTSAPDPRLEQLERWLERVFGSRDFQIEPASADASFRRYFRVTRLGESWIAMDAPPDKENMEPYVRVASMLRDAGVNAPRILEHDPAQGFLLNSDLGSQTYLAALEAGADAQMLYGDAIEALVRVQQRADAHARTLPSYDEAMLRREMALFPEWFCVRHLGIAPEHPRLTALAPVFDVLCASALEQPRVFVHRDYHSRNLMVCGGRTGANPGILDFQDAVRGPVTYDLVSLLRDCYIAWPKEQVLDWMSRFGASASSQGMSGMQSAEFRRWFDLMGVQRHLKAIGIFARLWHRDGKPGYLKDIPRTLDYVRAVGSEYRELQPLETFIDAHLLPAMQKLAPAQVSEPGSSPHQSVRDAGPMRGSP
jgi:aminoglycoside/choline kinase family phosphotransferase